jgi:hypothetical protein
MRRITLTIENQLLRDLKKKASEEGRTLQAVTNDLLRRSLSNPPTKPYKFFSRKNHESQRQGPPTHWGESTKGRTADLKSGGPRYGYSAYLILAHDGGAP